MTAAIGEPVLGLAEGRARLRRAARRLVLAWLGALLVATLLALSGALLVTAAVLLHLSWAQVVISVMVFCPVAYNLVRFWPRRPERRGVVLSADQVAELRGWMGAGSHDAAFDRVRVHPGAELLVTDHELTVGMPFLAVLGREELRGLVQHAVRVSEVDRHPVVRCAWWIERGGLGRGLWSRTGGDARFSRRLLGRVTQRRQELATAVRDWIWTCRLDADTAADADDLRARALAAASLATEGWDIVSHNWLAPAVVHGCRHTEPYSGLRAFLAAAERSDWLRQPLPKGPTAAAALPSIAGLEPVMAESLTGTSPPELLRPIRWEEHPAAVTVPYWLDSVSGALVAGRQARGAPVPATVNAVLDLMQGGWAPTLAAATAAAHGIKTNDANWARWAAAFALRTLTSLIASALLDERLVVAQWAWPRGVVLVADDGWVVPVEDIARDVITMTTQGAGMAAAYRDLREALVSLGLDLDQPLWLDHGSEEKPERVQVAFTAYQRNHWRQVVVTDRTLRVFHRPYLRGLREHYAMVRRGNKELHQRMAEVERGNLSDQVDAMARADVVQARLRLRIGGLGWRLTLVDGSRRLRIGGNGNGRVEADLMSEWLGDRFTTLWLDAPRLVRATRNALGYLAIGLGGLGLIMAGVWAVALPAGIPQRTPLVMASSSLALLALGALPELLVGVALWLRRPRLPSTLND